MKIYRYRPLNEFLYKELYYQEMYFASYLELNDPLDLSARIDFSPRKKEDIEDIFTYILFTSFDSGRPKSKREDINTNLIEFNQNKEKSEKFCLKLYEELNKINLLKKFVSIDDLEKILRLESEDFELKINVQKIRNKLQRQTKKFLQNSSAICFSEKKDNFLMWSHYASKHSGICLEFSLNKSRFPFKHVAKHHIAENYQENFAGWSNNGVIIPESLKKVEYQQTQPQINFFEFSFLFIDEDRFSGDELYYELSDVFSLKTTPWKYEKEWRCIHLNFEDDEYPENRIKHYPIECLTGIYFGIRTPEIIKNRIYNIFKLLRKDLKYYSCRQTNTKKLDFEEWEYFEE